jgi:glycosyltransferase involved in cell wall biosynthesis
LGKYTRMKILIVSDAWHPQVNGVVRTLQQISAELQRMGHKVEIVGPDASRAMAFSAPSYPSIKLEFLGRPRLGRIVDTFQPDFIHIATEGPLGWAGRNLCLYRRLPFTTSYHTRFPEYLAARVFPVFAKPVRIFCYAALRRFHAPSSAVMVATASMEDELRRRKFRHLVRWSRGVDTQLFRPYGKQLESYATFTRPIMLYVGRAAVEKNICAFLDIPTAGTKVVVGDGPDLLELKVKYPAAHFLGAREGEVLARHYAAADLFVFPSLTDTFGLVLLEACASGLRIASVPAPGPSDIFAEDASHAFAVLDADLGQAVRKALVLPDNPDLPRRFAEGFSWSASTLQFYNHLQASTPLAVKRITRIRNWLKRWWKHLSF